MARNNTTKYLFNKILTKKYTKIEQLGNLPPQCKNIVGG